MLVREWRHLATGVSSSLILFAASFISSCALPLEADTDIRFISYESLLLESSTRLFEDVRLSDYSQIVVDTPRHQIIVGLKNYLVRLKFDSLDVIEVLPWLPDNHTTSLCIAKGQNEIDCNNFIRVLILHNDVITVCGTYAFYPLCSTRKVNSLGEVINWSSGVTKCPYNPRLNNTYVMSSDGDLFSGTVTDFTGRDAAIYRIGSTSKRLRTAQYNSRWLNEPDFVSSYEFGDYIYFFFREAAIEYINCGKVVYSRVARICKSDTGGKVVLEDNWTTFVKARLNCSLPSTYPFYFNELQSTYFMEQQQLVYALFTTSPTSIYGSAVCVYNMSAIDEALSGAYKYQENGHSTWSRVPHSTPAKCGPSLERNSVNSQRRLMEVQKYQLVDDAVQSENELPAIVVEKNRFTHIVVDQAEVTQNSVRRSVPVVFLTTLEGVIHKYTLQKMDKSENLMSCLVEIMQVTPTDLPQPIRAMKLSHEKRGSLIIGTNTRLYRLPTQRCARFINENQCILMQDPYCGWNRTTNLCEPVGHPKLSSISCSVLQYPVYGEWSEWSEWETCSGFSSLDGSTGERCRCRSRSCDQPKPRLGGLTCAGERIQVVNCSVDGRWSSWSVWSECTVSQRHLNVRERTRQRDCNSPPARHDGQPCSGDVIQTEQCPDNSNNKNSLVDHVTLLPTTGYWSAWLEWTPCSAKCGGGEQSRHRFCSLDSRRCTGEDLQMRVCNTHKCPVVRKRSRWSQWYQVRNTSSQYELRLRCTCRTTRPADNFDAVCSPNIATERRQCGGATCVDALPAATPSASSACIHKCTTKRDPDSMSNTVDRQNSIVDKDEFVADESTVDGDGKHIGIGRSSLAGFCHCRDLGPLRVCRRCPFVGKSRAHEVQRRTFEVKDVAH